MKRYEVNQIKLITAISAELQRQCPGLPVDRRFNKIIEAANLIVAEFGREPVLAKPSMGLSAWLDCDDTGSSSLYMAWVLSNGCFGDWWGRKQPEPAYPRDADDFGRCMKLIEAVPEFYGIIYKMNGSGPEWSVVAANWESWLKLYKGENLGALCDQMTNAYAKARGEM